MSRLWLFIMPVRLFIFLLVFFIGLIVSAYLSVSTFICVNTINNVYAYVVCRLEAPRMSIDPDAPPPRPPRLRAFAPAAVAPVVCTFSHNATQILSFLPAARQQCLATKVSLTTYWYYANMIFVLSVVYITCNVYSTIQGNLLDFTCANGTLCA